MFRNLFYSILNTIIPPRPRENQLLSLTREDLENLRHEDGLPYHIPAVTALIWELKYNASARALKLAGEYLAEELMSITEEELGMPLLIPMPMHKDRKRERGYNQTELLCKAALAEIPSNTFEYVPNVLERVRHTVPQQTLARSKRLTNVKHSMQVADVSKVKGRICVVVDDVATTGATLAEAARALRAAKARKVYTLALARS